MAAADKREPRPFEPPPWEREQFHPHQGEGTSPAPPAMGETEQETTERLIAEAKAEIAAGQQAAAGDDEPAPEAPAQEVGEAEKAREAQMEAMLSTLSMQERVESPNAYRISMIAATFLAFIGVVFAVYAVVAFSRSYEAGFMAVAGSMILAFMGLILLGSAVWLGVRAQNRRGA